MTQIGHDRYIPKRLDETTQWYLSQPVSLLIQALLMKNFWWVCDLRWRLQGYQPKVTPWPTRIAQEDMILKKLGLFRCNSYVWEKDLNTSPLTYTSEQTWVGLRVDSWIDSNWAVSSLSHELLRINAWDRQWVSWSSWKTVASWIGLFPREALYHWVEN